MSTQSAVTKSSKARNPYDVVLSWLSPMSRGALSSDGHTVYHLQQLAVGWSCTCRGYAARQTCCHSLAASLPRCYHCDSTADVATYRNGWDNGAAISLCARCAGGK